MALRIQLLGGFRVLVGDCPIDPTAWRQRKAATLVKLLALAPGHALHRDQLVDRLWPDLDPAAAAGNLRKALHLARRILATAAPEAGRALQHDGERLSLHSLPGLPLCVDVEAFETAACHGYVPHPSHNHALAWLVNTTDVGRGPDRACSWWHRAAARPAACGRWPHPPALRYREMVPCSTV